MAVIVISWTTATMMISVPTEKEKTMTKEGVTILALMLWFIILIRPGRY